jgi:hypothetical protein
MNSKKTCDKCEHYTPDKSEVVFGECALMGDCNEEGTPDNTRAYGWDYEGYSAGVYVGKKFGCIHWAKKER